MKTFAIIIASLLAVILITIMVMAIKLKRQLRNIRDNADLTTSEGRYLVRQCNEKLDELNGFKKKKKKAKK